MKFSTYDRVLIHGLALMSRPPLIPAPEDHQMLVRILTDAADRATPEARFLKPLIREARRVASHKGPPHAIAHHTAAAMNEFDRTLMAIAWNLAREGAA